ARDRSRDPWDRRGPAREVAREDPARDALARRRRRGGVGARREPPRLATRSPGIARGPAAGRPPCRRAPRGSKRRAGSRLGPAMKLSVAPEVAKALEANAPVVALESTVIAHGLPRPRNLTTARALETEIRALGVVPATIALHDGVAVVGAGDVLLERLANESGVAKVSVRDIAPILAARSLGATTVAATVEIAAAAGIQVVATGGIGGVHRGAEQSFDESADLTPYLLRALGEATNYRALDANIALLRANAQVAAQLALTLCG